MLNMSCALMLLFGQTVVPMAFEVASIKEVSSSSVENVGATLSRQTVSTVGTGLDERNAMGYFGQDS